MNKIWPDWVMDVTNHKEDIPPRFCPVAEDDAIVIGMNVRAAKCPGNLVGIFHDGGPEAAEQWAKEHPDWHKKYQGEKHDN